ncbi:tetratricopeptide repeat protein, partial [candidate division CSSED10-310 bacterium]
MQADSDDELMARDRYESLPLPLSLQELIERRLLSLSDGSRHLLRAVAVVGREADVLLAQEMTGTDTKEFPFILEELVQRQILEQQDGITVRFAHNMIREVTLSQLEVEECRILHLQAAQGIEKLFATRKEEYLAELGRHWEGAGNFAEACSCYLKAARRAKERYDHEQAERLYRAYLNLVQTPNSDSITARNELGYDLLQLVGRSSEAISQHKLAVEEARRVGLRKEEAEGYLLLGIVYWSMGHYDLAYQYSGQALTIHQQTGNRESEGKTLHNLAVFHSEHGLIDEALNLYEQALVIHQEVGNKTYEGMSLHNQATILRDLGNADQSQQMHQNALRIFQKIGNRKFEAFSLASLGSIEYKLGNVNKGIQLIEQALRIHRDVGNRRGEGGALSTLAFFHYLNGNMKQSRDLMQLALVIYREVEDLQSEVTVLIQQAGFERQINGNLSLCFRKITEAHSILAKTKNKLNLVSAFCEQGHYALARGQSAHSFIEKIKHIIENLPSGSTGLTKKSIPHLTDA